MNITPAKLFTTVILTSTLLMTAGCQSGESATSSNGVGYDSLGAQSRIALNQLRLQNPAAAALYSTAKGVLVIPEVIKGGFIVGGFHGQGAMIRNGIVTGYYDSSGGSYGLQAGLQTFSYALFFMTESDLKYLDNSDGWEVGVGPNVTIVDEGMASSLTTTTGRSGVYCFFFNQKGLMAGLGIQGSKITRLNR